MAKLKGNILIVDDDAMVLLSAQLLLEQHYTHVVKINTPHQIPEAFKEYPFDLVLLDMNFKQGETSGSEGLKWLTTIKEISPQTNVLLMTAYSDVDLAVEAMKNGAMDFIIKPWQNEKLLATVKNGIALTNEQKRVKQLESREKAISSRMDSEYANMIGNSQAINQIKNLIDKVAKTDAIILITGENGTGKEVVARAIHNQSGRSNEAFVAVDLGSISETLLESELFGHKKGAFTDAKEDRIGRFEAANGGTIFLDEIGNLSLAAQAKLLTVLQRKQITKVGDNVPTDIEARVICATNINIQEQVKNGGFREDLYYRINTVVFDIPPLRERPSDIKLLAQHYFKIYGMRYHKEPLKINEQVYELLQAHKWPGNVRELQHAIERAIILSDNEAITPSSFHFIQMNKNESMDFDSYNLEELEAWAIHKAIKKHNGNISHAAKELGLSRGAMYRRMEKYGL